MTKQRHLRKCHHEKNRAKKCKYEEVNEKNEKRKRKLKREEKEFGEHRKEAFHKSKSKEEEKGEISGSKLQVRSENQASSTPIENNISLYHLKTPISRWTQEDVTNFLHSIGLERIEVVTPCSSYLEKCINNICNSAGISTP